jgi:dimethylargininase
MIALTHLPSPNMQSCERTFVGQTAIDHALAERQHATYCEALKAHGARVVTVNVNRELPDCCFIEDTAVVLDEVAILASMGAESRRLEAGRIEGILREYRDVVRIERPATIEGGDVLRVGRKLFVGQSCRTNIAGIRALNDLAKRFGYTVVSVPVRGCLHLKTACTALPDGRLLVNSAWIDAAVLAGEALIEVPRDEPWGANIALLGDRVLAAATHSQTTEIICELGFGVNTIDISEFSKAEGGVTCLSILFS